MASFLTAILVLNLPPSCIGVTHERLGGGYALYMIVLSALYAAKVCTSPDMLVRHWPARPGDAAPGPRTRRHSDILRCNVKVKFIFFCELKVI